MGLAEYLQLWDMFSDIALNDNEHGLNHRASFLPGRLIVLSSLVQPPLSLGNRFGNPGHQGNAKPSFGWPSATVAGQLTDYKREDFHIQSIAPFVTRMIKRFSIYSLHVFLLDNSGSAFYNP